MRLWHYDLAVLIADVTQINSHLWGFLLNLCAPSVPLASNTRRLNVWPLPEYPLPFLLRPEMEQAWEVKSALLLGSRRVLTRPFEERSAINEKKYAERVWLVPGQC